MRKFIVALLFVFASMLTLAANAQQYKKTAITSKRKTGEHRKQPFYLGIGFGLDYGGVGLRAEAVPIKQLGIFAGGGYNFFSLGYNAGLSFKILPDREVCPVVVGMYGYNAVIVSKDGKGRIFNGNTYYGPTAGAGVEFKSGRWRSNKLNLLMLVPFRNDDFREDAERMDVTFFPLAISVGFVWGIQ